MTKFPNITKAWIVPDLLPTDTPYYSIGIDPGKNFGMTVITNGAVIIMRGILDDATGEDSFNFVKDFLYNYNVRSSVLIEGASYGERFGQVSLAEIRFGFKLAFELSGYRTSYIPPSTPRKMILQDGRKKLGDIYKDIDKNALDSLLIAICNLVNWKEYIKDCYG